MGSDPPWRSEEEITRLIAEWNVYRGSLTCSFIFCLCDPAFVFRRLDVRVLFVGKMKRVACVCTAVEGEWCCNSLIIYLSTCLCVYLFSWLLVTSGGETYELLPVALLFYSCLDCFYYRAISCFFFIAVVLLLADYLFIDLLICLFVFLVARDIWWWSIRVIARCLSVLLLYLDCFTHRDIFVYIFFHAVLVRLL